MIINTFKLTRYFRSFFFGTFLIFNFALYGAKAPMPGMPGMPEMSEAEMQKFMSELENTAKEIDNFVNSLPPEEQAEFNKAVQEVEQMINNMSPDELEQFIGGMFGAQPTEEQPEKPVEPEPIVEEPKKVEAPQPTQKELSEQEKVLNLIDAILKKTQSFLVKAQGMPELAGKAKRWGQQKRIRNWQADLTWNEVKSAIDVLVQKLHKMKDKDPKTSQYKFLKDLIEDKSLVNNLNLLRSTLDQYEPNIEVSAFGIEKMPTKAKNSLQQIISAFTESLYVLKTPAALNTIIAKYEPRAKELAEEEKKIEKRAQTMQKKPGASQTITAGTAESEATYGGGGYGYDDYGYGDGYNGGGYGGYSPSSGGYTSPSYAPETTSGLQNNVPGVNGKPGTAEKAPSNGSKEKEGKPTAIAGTPSETKQEPSKESAQKKPFEKEMATAEIYLDEITNELSKAVNTIKSTELLNGDITQNITQEPNDKIANSINAINDLQNTFKNIDEQMSKLQLKAKSPALKKAYKQKLENIFKEIKVDKTTIKPKIALHSLISQIDTIKQDQLPLIKQFAYFGTFDEADKEGMQKLMAIKAKEEQPQENENPVELTAAEQAIKQKYEPILQAMEQIKVTPTSLLELRNKIQGLLDRVRNFDKSKSS